MKHTILLLLAAVAMAAGSGWTTPSSSELQRLARSALSENQQDCTAAIKALRGHGEAGLQALIDLYKNNDRSLNRPDDTPPEVWERYLSAVDAVGKQKDCYASRLYWLTDFEQAKTLSRETGKPILSLRLLGQLDEEFSCANSRFFRTTLYPNPQVSDYLRDNFVLHWKSVRPVPRITIDFGDGRRLERTITGNSIHYVLASDGSVIDALPGLFSASEFLAGLSNAVKAAKTYETIPETERAKFRASYHKERIRDIDREYMNALAELKQPMPALAFSAVPPANPNARQAGAMAVHKGAVELSTVKQLVFTINTDAAGSLVEQMTAPIWSNIASLYEHQSKLDPVSMQAVRSKNPIAAASIRVALTKQFSEQPLTRLITNLERSIADDTMKTKVLIVEDDPHILLGLEEILKSEGFEVFRCNRGDQAVCAVRTEKPALIILDVMLPGQSGFDICKQLRSIGNSTPILMLTAKGEEMDKVIGLDLGADDYVTKPFGLRELLARIHALLRRASVSNNVHFSEQPFQIGESWIDPKTFELRRGNHVEELTAKEMNLIRYFHEHTNEVLSRDRLLNEVWGYEYVGTTRTLDQVIVQLRKKLGDNHGPSRHLVTVHGIGYKLVP